MKHALPLGALALLSFLPACVINSGSHVEHSGRRFSRETLAELTPGRSREFTLGLLGEPTSRSTADAQSEIWKWDYKTREHKSGSLILVLESDKTTETCGTTYVLFQDGAVAKVWQD